MNFSAGHVVYIVTRYQDVKNHETIDDVKTGYQSVLIDWKKQSQHSPINVYMLADPTQAPVLIFNGREYTDVEYDPDYQQYKLLRQRYEKQT